MELCDAGDASVVWSDPHVKRSSRYAALRLSPLDPLAYGMLGVRAFSHIALDEPEEAERRGERAARAPQVHPLIELIAAVGVAAHGERVVYAGPSDEAPSFQTAETLDCEGRWITPG